MTTRLVKLCEKLGLLVTQDKSELDPTQMIVFQGKKTQLVQGRAFPRTITNKRWLQYPPKPNNTTHCLPSPGAKSLLILMSANAPTIQLTECILGSFPVGGNTSSTQRKRQDLDSSDRSNIPSTAMVDTAISLGNDFSILSPSPQDIVFIDASTRFGSWRVAF